MSSREPSKEHQHAQPPATETLEGFSDWHQIGRGGDALVYRAVHDALGRDVAIKVLSVGDLESVSRFTREVQVMVALGRQHPNIAEVLQIGTSSFGRPCIVMEHYELGSLDKRLSQHGPLSAAEVIHIGTVIADALAFAHSQGVLHRDVKPQNILILPGSYVLADFGIARLIDTAPSAGSERFSYRHASPQVLNGDPPSESDDLFSLGATLFHLLDGKPPFTKTATEPDSALAYIERVATAEPRPLLRPDLPSGLAEVIARCLEKAPESRFATSIDLRNELAALHVDGAEKSPRPSGPPRRSAGEKVARVPSHPLPWDLTFLRQAVTHSMPLLGIALGGVVGGVLLTVLLWSLRPTQTVIPAQSPASASPTVQPQNPNLAPRDLRVIIEGDEATARWDRAIDEPDSYFWGVASAREVDPVIRGQLLSSERSIRTPIGPAWDQVCFTILSTREGEFGGAKTCVSR